MAEKKAKDLKKAPEPEEAPKSQEAALAGKESAKSGGKLKLILLVVVAMVVGGVGAFAALKFLSKPPAPTQELVEGTEPALGENPEPPLVAPTKSKEPPVAAPAHGGGEAAPGAEGTNAEAVEGPRTVALKPFTTNLNEPSGRRFLKVTLGLEVESQAAEDELNKMLPDIQDAILILLSSQSTEDISTVDGKERLRSQIQNRCNSFLTNNKVKKVKYSEFIIQ
ncbi:MAG: flagellar basal body-associated FliL family protein [Deltaproteobacteria bacterium]|jgi:flagellar FliL protein|nr:flagellar basal body-associated FliL family protein [Deltaproteobacteria bacterium]